MKILNIKFMNGIIKMFSRKSISSLLQMDNDVVYRLFWFL